MTDQLSVISHESLFNAGKGPCPTHAAIHFVDREKNHGGNSDDVILRYESPVAGVHREVTIVTHHKEVIHPESVSLCVFTVDENGVIFYREFVVLIVDNDPFPHRKTIHA